MDDNDKGLQRGLAEMLASRGWIPGGDALGGVATVDHRGAYTLTTGALVVHVEQLDDGTVDGTLAWCDPGRLHLHEARAGLATVEQWLDLPAGVAPLGPLDPARLNGQLRAGRAERGAHGTKVVYPGLDTLELVGSGDGVTVELATTSLGVPIPGRAQIVLTEEQALAALAVRDMRVLIREALTSPEFAWLAEEHLRVARLEGLVSQIDLPPEVTYRKMALLLDPRCGADAAPAARLPAIAELALLKLLARHGRTQPLPAPARDQPALPPRNGGEPIVAHLLYQDEADLVVGQGIVAVDGHLNVRTYAMDHASHALLRRIVNKQRSTAPSELPVLARVIDGVLRRPWTLHRDD
jgi:hypothetical protein